MINYKKGISYLCHWALLLMALLMLYWIYPYLYRALPYNRSWPMLRAQHIRLLLKKMRKDQPFSLVIGSCSAESSIRADILEGLKKGPWYNLSVRGSTPGFYKKLAGKIKDEGLVKSLDTVLLVISPTDLTLKEEELAKKSHDFKRGLDTIEDILKSESAIDQKIEDLFIAVFYQNLEPWYLPLSLEFILKEKQTWHQYRELTYGRLFEDELFWDPVFKGGVTFNVQRASALIQKNQDFLFEQKRKDYLLSSEMLEGRLSLTPGLKITAEMIEAIEALSSLSKKLIVLIPPEYPFLYEIDPGRGDKVRALFLPLLKKGIDVQDFSQYRPEESKAFLDLDHLSLSASAQFSTHFWKQIWGNQK